MEDTISQAKAQLVRAKERIARSLSHIPDDRLNWSPSPTARTPVQLVAHVALSMPAITGLLDGGPFPFTDTAEADRAIRGMEKPFNSREQVLALLEEKTAAHLAWLDAMTLDKLASTVDLPFGSLPMPAALTLLPDHLFSHAAQIDYIQTIYGDHNWYM